MKRYVIVNPDGPWIQGDLHARDHDAAAAYLESKLSAPTANDVWLVFEAPKGFPPASTGYATNDPAALALLDESYHIEVRNGLIPEQADLFAAPAPGR